MDNFFVFWILSQCLYVHIFKKMLTWPKQSHVKNIFLSLRKTVHIHGFICESLASTNTFSRQKLARLYIAVSGQYMLLFLRKQTHMASKYFDKNFIWKKLYMKKTFEKNFICLLAVYF